MGLLLSINATKKDKLVRCFDLKNLHQSQNVRICYMNAQQQTHFVQGSTTSEGGASFRPVQYYDNIMYCEY